MSPRDRDVTPDTSKHASTTKSPILALSEHLLQPNGSIIGRHVADAVLPFFPTFASAIPTNLPSQPALASIDGRKAVSHARIQDFVVNDFGSMLHNLGFGKGDRVALVLPNGPELAMAIVATAHWASCVPLSANGAPSELEADLLRCGADLIVGPYSGVMASQPAQADSRFHAMDSSIIDWSVFRQIEESAKRLSIPFVGLMPSPTEAGIFRLVPTRFATPLSFDAELTLSSLRRGTKPTGLTITAPNAAEDEVLVLFTSGTTGNKKLVPHLMGDMLTAAATIALSWALTPEDVNCNLMPLFHVGGIVRQVFSPLFSGGCVICCPSFDPSIFWALLEKRAFTWYYAAPTMHQVILQMGRQPADGAMNKTMQEEINPKLRMIANAAGGLLPSLAVQLRETFKANVLPSYGMTECMPISSPPATYELEKPGTSGVAVGPELAILNTSTAKPLPCGQEGPICVRGAPCFRGYGKIANDPSQTVGKTFLKDGWFDTGDLGYMDEEGYLYITGRSKEVINRGGEIISPMEVEEALMGHPDILACAAFSALHNVLQEVVGIVVVMVPDRPRVDLLSLHEFLGERLAAPKWPQCLVFMDGLPKSHTNKLLRVKLGERLRLPELSDDMSPLQRTFEAECPPQGTPLETPIPSKPVTVSQHDVQTKLINELSLTPEQQLIVVPSANRFGANICYVWNVDRTHAIQAARASLHRYAVPTHVIELQKPFTSGSKLAPPSPFDAVSSILQRTSYDENAADSLVQEVQQLFIDLLQLDFLPAPEANFFHLGGSSMMASQLASKIRKQFQVPCSGAEIFHHSSCLDLAKFIRSRSSCTGRSSETVTTDDTSIGSKSVDDHGAPFSTSRLPMKGKEIFATIFQLLPIFVIFPMWQVSRYLLFFLLLLRSFDVVPGERDVGTFVIAYIVFHTIWITVTPLVFVAIKWLIIGRYRAGRYPIWGSYYLRWWFVDICRKLFLRGIYGCNESTLNFYYRLLGASIGAGARISLECDVAEFDLVYVGDHAAVEYATLRGFGVDNGAMILGPVTVGNRASVGARSVVAPYTSVQDGCHLGPVTSSYEVSKGALAEKHAKVNRKYFPEPSIWMQVMVGGPITFLVNSFGQIPPLLVLMWMLQYKGKDNQFETINDLMSWLCDFKRIPFYIGIRLARSLLSPFFYMAAALFVKKFLIGRFKQGPRNTTNQWQLMRHWLAATLFSRKKIQNLSDLVGRHYEIVSILFRLLGAKVGKRVFWPGRIPVTTGEFEMFEVGDDVVFGSRSCIFFSTDNSCEKVILCAGSNVADNCVVLPGSIVGKSAVMGSNTLCPAGWYLPEGSVWLGAKSGEPRCLEQGNEGHQKIPIFSSSIDASKLQMIGDATTVRPFGKAFYQGKATYFTWPLSWMVAFSFAMRAMITTFHTFPLLGALVAASTYLYGGSFELSLLDYQSYSYSFGTVYATILSMFLWTNFLRVALWIAIELFAKWTLMGQRRVGRYNYDTSSYALRWEIYQLICKIRKVNRLNLLEFISGSPFMNAYFRWNGGIIGRNCCLYPSGADPFMPEPDLVVIGDNCVVDCASIVCHLNTRGNFELARIIMEDNCTLRTRSRIQQGVYMERGSQLLEKSLALTGEVVEANSVWQGGPASWWFQYPSKVIPFGRSDSDDNDSSITDNESTVLLRDSSSIPSYRA